MFEVGCVTDSILLRSDLHLKPADILELPTSGWDKRIAADLTAEMEQHLAEKISTVPEMRRFLAVKGYRELRELIERDIAGKKRRRRPARADAEHAPLRAGPPGNVGCNFSQRRHRQPGMAGSPDAIGRRGPLGIGRKSALRASWACMRYGYCGALCAASHCTKWARRSWIRSRTIRATNSASRFSSGDCRPCGRDGGRFDRPVFRNGV